MSQVNMPEVIHRYATPSKHDEAPIGTLCKVEIGKEVEVYAQVGKLETKWILVGSYNL